MPPIKYNNPRVSASARAIFETLKTDIALGRLHPRERLVEQDLVNQFKSHRPAVREALNLLTQIGLIVHVPNKGVSVSELTLEELKRIYDMRIELEGLSARWISLPLSKEAIEALEAIQAQHTEAIEKRDHERIFKLDLTFHNTLNSHNGNPHLQEMVDLMSTRGLLARYSVQMDKAYLAAVRDDHLSIIRAIKAEDQDGLINAVVQHQQRGAKWYASLLNK